MSEICLIDELLVIFIVTLYANMHLTSRNILPLPVAILFEAGNLETLTACKKS